MEDKKQVKIQRFHNTIPMVNNQAWLIGDVTRKGIAQVISIHGSMISNNASVELNIISSLTYLYYSQLEYPILVKPYLLAWPERPS